jgi:putative ABC transport system permease protein
VRAFFRLVSLGTNLIRKKTNEHDLSEEIASHLELLIAENIRAGFDETEARRVALLELGGAEQVKEQVREARAGYSLDAFLQDLHYGARVLWRSPLFTVTAILTLALALGASGAAFTLIKSRLLRPLDYAGAGELLQISAVREAHDADLSFPRFSQIRARQDVFAGVAALVGERSAILRGGIAEQTSVAHVSDRFFETVGLRPLMGRFFLPGEKDALLLSYNYWQTQFGGDAKIIEQPMTLGGARARIVGVLPRSFRVPFGDFDVYVPQVTGISFLAAEQIQRGAGFLKVIARSRPGVSVEQVRAALRVTDKNYRERAHENMDGNAVSRASPLRESAVRPGRAVVYTVVAAVACVLLLSCINVVSLILSRLARREREIAVRYALGAGRNRIFQQLACENIFIAIMAGMSGVLFARIGLATINFFSPDFLRADELRFSAASIAFIIILTFGIAVVLAIVCVPRITRDRRGAALRQTVGFTHRAVSSVSAFLLVIQIALSLLLATGAGLMLTSLHRIHKVDPGLDAKHLFVADISPPFDIVVRNESAHFVQLVIERLKTIPGITDAAAVYGLPLAHDDTFLSYAVADESKPTGKRPVTWYRSVSPDYFTAMRIPLRIGRAFTDADGPGNPNVVVISETTARLLFGDNDPLGQKIVCGGTIPKTYEVIGVVGDVRSLNLAQPVREEMYFSMFQSEEPSMKLVVRAASGLGAKAVAEKIQTSLRALSPNELTLSIQTMRQIMARSVARGRFVAVALGFFASMALCVAMIGIYGVMDYAVSVRTREIGTRLVLGARPGHLFRLMLAGGMRLVVAGLLIGAPLTFYLTRHLSALLYDVRANDPIIFVGATLLLATIAFLANYLPARRAMRIAPLVALQNE